MSAPRRSHLALQALLTLPPELREVVAESVRRDERSRPRSSPIDPRRVSMTAHLREVLRERGLTATWQRHFAEHAMAESMRISGSEIERRPIHLVSPMLESATA